MQNDCAVLCTMLGIWERHVKLWLTSFVSFFFLVGGGRGSGSNAKRHDHERCESPAQPWILRVVTCLNDYDTLWPPPRLLPPVGLRGWVGGVAGHPVCWDLASGFDSARETVIGFHFDVW
jgi:hypothetical protein